MPRHSRLALVQSDLDAPTEFGVAADSAMVWRLYIVREVARAHGGDVEVRSDMQETVFAVRLPRRNEVSSPEQHQSSSQENAWDKAPS